MENNEWVAGDWQANSRKQATRKGRKEERKGTKACQCNNNNGYIHWSVSIFFYIALQYPHTEHFAIAKAKEKSKFLL